MIYRTSLALLLILLCGVVHSGQKKDISESEFWIAVQRSREKAEGFNHRKTRKVVEFEGAKITRSNEWLTEVVLPDRKRWVDKSKVGAKTSITEQITIGQATYCRKNRGPWLMKDCREMTLSGGGSNISQSFSIDEALLNGNKVSHYVYYRTFGKESDPNFDKFECWIDANGRIQRELASVGSIRTGKLFSRNTASYEYNPKDLKIEAPKMN